MSQKEETSQKITQLSDKRAAWEKEANKNFTVKNAPLAVLAGCGCPKCGHICSFDEEDFHCNKCDWDWKDVK